MLIVIQYYVSYCGVSCDVQLLCDKYLCSFTRKLIIQMVDRNLPNIHIWICLFHKLYRVLMCSLLN